MEALLSNTNTVRGRRTSHDKLMAALIGKFRYCSYRSCRETRRMLRTSWREQDLEEDLMAFSAEEEHVWIRPGVLAQPSDDEQLIKNFSVQSS